MKYFLRMNLWAILLLTVTQLRAYSLVNETGTPETSNVTAREGSVALVIGDQAYLGLGNNDNTYFSDWINITDDGSAMTDFPGVARTSAVGFVIDNIAYVGLGKDDEGNYLKDFYSYNPTNDSWTQIADFGGSGRINAVAFAIDDYGYVGTGRSSSDEEADFWKYNPTTNSWTELSDWGSDKRQGAFAFVIHGKGYVGGGFFFDSYSMQLSDIQEFDPETETWTEKIYADGNNLSTNYAAAFSLYGYGYIAYGSSDDLVRYDPEENEVENLGDYFDLGDSRNDAIAFVLNEVGYFGLGSTGIFSTTYYNDLYSYSVPNEIPTNITLSSQSIEENNDADDLVATLSATDADQTEDPTFALVSGNGSNDAGNSAFYISGTKLYASGTFDYETQDEYAIYIQVTDSRGGTYKKAFTITIEDVNEAPYNLTLTNATIEEDNEATVAVGTLAAEDIDENDHLYYTLATGDGSNDADNNYFSISANQLNMVHPNFETQSEYQVNIAVTDDGGLSTTQSFAISVEDVNEAPSDISMEAKSLTEESTPGTLAAVFSTTDEDADQTFTYTLTDASNHFELRDDSLFTTTVFDIVSDQSYTIEITSTDQDGLSLTKSFDIEVELLRTLATEEGSEILIFPNPFIDELTLDDPSADKIEMFNVSGTIVLYKNMNGLQQTFDTSTLEKGIYILRVYEGQTGKSYKLIKE